MALLFSIVLVSWLISMAAGGWSILLALGGQTRGRLLSLAPAAVALCIGYLGFGHWSPFRFFPQIGWMYTSGNLRIHLASSWFFALPLLLGALAVALVIRRNVTDKD